MIERGRNLLAVFATALALTTGSPLVTRDACRRGSVDEFAYSHLGLIISPIISSKEIRVIEIYWNHANWTSGDVIALYDEEPTSGAKRLYAFEPTAGNGIRKTDIQADFVPTSDLTFARQCLKYHVAWLRNNTVRKTSCLETRPNWLADRREALGKLKLRDVFLPGTHDSAAYAVIEKPETETLIDKYVTAQDEDILAQLIYGTRYLDIRVGYYPLQSQVWWGNHGIVKVVPLQTIIDDVKTFLDNTNEIVMFDIHEFPIGFEKDLSVHNKLASFLEEQFADYLLPKSYGWSSTLNTIWDSGKRLVVSYNERNIVSRYDGIWPPVTQQWGDVRSVADLYTYLSKVESNARGSTNVNPRSTMAQLTPNTWDVLLDRLGGLRKMAEDVNANVTNWYDTKWQSTANIVSVDFIKSSGIIETAIEWNDRRASSC